MTHSRPTVHRLLEEHGLHARRELGQNFVADPNTVRRIAELSRVGPGDHVVEIGPGLGSLTLALVETGAKVVAVEVDAGLAEAASEVLGDSAEVIEADARDLDWDTIHPGADEIHVVANLPYNIGTSLVIDILAGVPRVRTLTVLVQTEVAERFGASPGTSAYGIPSVMVALYGTAELVARVPATVFVPKPKVESALARIVRHDQPPTDVSHEALATVVRAGFGQRRKMIRRSLKPLIDEEALVSLGLDPTVRAEELSLLDWATIAEAVAS